jgi:hypothetical protein
MRIKYKIGDICKIPIGKNKFVFGRLMRDASIQVFRKIYSGKEKFDSEKTESLTCQGVFDTALKSGEWKIVDHMPFLNDEESWPPPHYIKDVILDNTYRIYHKGEMRSAKKSEIKGLEEALMFKPNQFVEEIKVRLKALA